MPLVGLFRSAFLSVLLLLAIAGQGAFAQSAAEAAESDSTIDEIVAVVEDDIILRSDVDGLVANVAQQQQQQPTDELWMQALNELINQEIMAAEAEKDTTLEVGDEQVDQAMDQRLNQMMQQVGGEEQLEQLYGQSLIQIREELREDFRKQMLAQQFQQTQMNDVNITPSEVREWFAQFPADSLPELPDIVRIAHIVRYPSVPESAEEEAREIISAIRDSVEAGADIEDMARRYSDDTGSAQQGGRFTDTELGDLVPEFGAVAARLDEGDLSEPFRTPFGYHIMRLNSRSGDNIDFNHVLIRVDESSADAEPAIEYLSAVRDSIVNHGADFSTMARRHSEEEQSAQNGGRVLDPRSGERDLMLDALSSSWQETIRSLEPGEISEPREVELLDGERAVHIIELQEHTPAHIVDFEDDYERIHDFALQEKRARKMQDWIADLREDVYIDYRGKAARLREELPDEALQPDMEMTPPAEQQPEAPVPTEDPVPQPQPPEGQ